MATLSDRRVRLTTTYAGAEPEARALPRAAEGPGPATRVASWAAVPVLLVAMNVLDAVHLRQAYGSPALVFALNLLFLFAMAAVVAVLVTRSFLARGDAGLLLLSGGVVLWGLTAFAAGALALDGANASVTLHNLGALLAGASNAVAAALLQGRAWRVRRRRGAAAATWAAALIAVALLALLAHRDALPLFFVQGVGGTPLRQGVLSAAIAAFAVGAAGLARGSSRSGFRHWYALGLGLIAVGLYGVLLQETWSSPLGWLGRLAQYLGGLATLVAAISSIRAAQSWALPLGALLERSEARYRALFENMTEGCLLAEAALPDQPGNRLVLMDANPAALAMTGLDPDRALGQPLRGLFPALDPAVADACTRVLESGRPERLGMEDRERHRHVEMVIFRPEPGRLALLFSDDSERQRYEQALEDANARLQDVDRNKSRFLAVLSHELRNPLAPIRNAAATLERADAASEHARRAREILLRQVDHLTRLVDELLDLTRIASGKIQLRRAELDLCELVRRAAEDRRDSFAGRSISFTVDVPGDALRASGDATRLAQVVGNLLQNAAKFTPAGGAVTLSLVRSDGQAELSVRDTGVGIEPALLGRLFDPFVQGEATLARSEGGLGLGLALVKGLVELHGGSIEARSEGSGRGTEMIVRLPLLPRDAAAPSATAPAGTSPAGP